MNQRQRQYVLSIHTITHLRIGDLHRKTLLPIEVKIPFGTPDDLGWFDQEIDKLGDLLVRAVNSVQTEVGNNAL